MTGDRMCLGVDLDNTIVGYDDVFSREAWARGWLPGGLRLSKRAVRDHVRQLPDGERRWQQLQAAVYGPGMEGADLLPGAAECFRSCRELGIPVAIISHKTTYAAYDETATNLRDAAMQWLATRGFFDPEGPGLTPAQIHFTPTRSAKIAKIEALGCTHFIDDLEETFLEPAFPRTVGKILFCPSGAASTVPGVVTVTSWQEVHGYLIATRHPRR